MKARWLCFGVVLLAGCTAGLSDVDPTPPPAQSASEQVAADFISADTPKTAAPLTLYQPQLVRKASLSLEVKDAEAAGQQAIRWTRAAGGEVLNLTDNGVTGEVRRLTLEVQVPAMRLDEVLMQFSSLGRLENREVTAEDVSNQLVDVGARLRNLRQAEALLLKMMERSGSVADVLKVAQELTQVREQIEQLDAQRVNLQNRVRYAQIRLRLTTPPAAKPPPHVGERLAKTWQAATTALGMFTLGVVELAVWLVVFSPYLIAAGFPIFWLMKRRVPSRPKS
jgi:hypothetical protein